MPSPHTVEHIPFIGRYPLWEQTWHAFNPVHFEHPRAHFVHPASGEIKNPYSQFTVEKRNF